MQSWLSEYSGKLNMCLNCVVAMNEHSLWMSVTYIHGICIPDKQRNVAKLFQEIGKMFLNSCAV